jgi:hypothetical protein
VIVRVWVGTSVFIRRPVPASEMLANDLDPTRGCAFRPLTWPFWWAIQDLNL